MDSLGGYIGVSFPRINKVRRNAPIAAEFEECVQLFQQLCSSMEADGIMWSEAQMPLDDGFSRLRAFGNDTGASSWSLDHALRKASRLHQQVLDLLQDLRGELEKALTIVQTTAILLSPPIKLSEDVEYFNILPRQVETPQSLGIDPDDTMSQIVNITESVEETLDCLSGLVLTLQDPAPEDTYRKDASPTEAHKDIELAKSMFPKASEPLITRIGRANWKRRQYQRDLRDRKAKTALTIVEPPSKLRPGLKSGMSFRRGAPGLLDATIDTQLASPFEHLQASDPTVSRHRVVFNRALSDLGMLSNPETVFSKASYFDGHSVTSISESDHHTRVARYVVPKPPIVLQSGKEFLCPYCLHEIRVGDDIRSADDWAEHVFVDLEPYMCTWDTCVRADRTFGLRDEWFRHELDSHRIPKIWFCQTCRVEFGLGKELADHLREKHKNTLEPIQLDMMVSMCERYSQKPLRDQECSLCGSFFSNAEGLKGHLAYHLEQLALTSVNSDDGLENEAETEASDERRVSKAVAKAPETSAKQERVDSFIQELRHNVFASRSEQEEEPANLISTDSDPGFLGDSDDEMIHSPVEDPTTRPGGRPVIKRHGESYISKVENFLNQQSRVVLGPAVSHVEPSKEKVLEDASHTVVHTEGTRTIRTMPPPRNDVFVGRESDLAKLYKELSIPGHTCILSGAGGMGKSATAIEYTYQFERAYSYIFWVHAETPVGCADSYGRIATTLVLEEGDTVEDQDRLTMLSREFLEQTDQRWLVVFDNVDELLDLQQYLPRNLLDTRGSILITTRKIDLGRLTAPSNYARIELGVLTLEDSQRLLLSATNVPFKDMRSHPEYQLAGEIANYAERLPLALSHVAGYIQVSGCSLSDFVELWKERRRHTTFHPPTKDALTKTDKALEIVWNIGLREVTIDARELLNILAFLDSDTIQKDLLVGEHEEPSLDLLHSSETFRYKRMTVELSRRRLISVKMREGEEIISIHRSLQAKILQDLEKDSQKREKVFGQAFLLVRRRFPLPSPIQVPEPEKWPACIKYLRHVLSLQKVFMGQLITIAPSVDLARLLSDGGIGLWERGMTSEGLQLMKSAEAVLQKLNCKEDMLKANIHVIIALLIQDYGIAFLAESKDRIWQALQIRKDFQSRTPSNEYKKTDDILLHNAWSDYGCVLLQYNKYKEAEPIFKHCLAKYRKWGPDEDIPYEHAKYNHHMAFCQMYYKNFTEAIPLAERGLHFVILATGPQSASTHKWKFDLSCIVLQSGDLERALQLHTEVLEARIQQHGKSSFLTLQSYYAVGALNAYLGHLVPAETYMREALGRENSRKEVSPEAAIARTEFHLAQLLREQEKDIKEAEALETQAREVLATLLPLSPLDGVPPEHELALFDHLQPVFDGRFTGRLLLQYVS